MKKKKGFTLIEVIVAMAIFLIVILALVGNYYSYYNSVKQMAYKAIGQNLAELQLEDLRNLSVSVTNQLIQGTYFDNNYPSNKSIYPKYDSEQIDSSYVVEHILNILGTENSETLPPGVSYLPSSIEIQPILRVDPLTGDSYYDYTVILHKEAFPYYKKEIIIDDETPLISDFEKKIYKTQIMVFWTVGGQADSDHPGEIIGGTTKSITLTTEKSFRQ
jgi:prepilin-type N-terminal cleavage/methylation domain-containing protein